MSYDDYLAGDPVVITAALTGGVHGKEASPHLPETPEEIADAAEACEAAGASVVHLHARRENGERSFSRERFQELTDAVRERTDLIVQHSTGGTGAPDDIRHEPLRTDPAPDMASLDMGPLNRYQHLTSENTRGLVESLAEEMRERGIKPEMEVFNGGHLNEVHELLDRRPDLLEEPIYTTLIFGGGTTAMPTPDTFRSLVNHLPRGAQFNTLGFGQHQLPFGAMGIVFGGHVRVGLEDNRYFRQGELATNAQLVERAATLAETLQRPVATPDDAREILDI
ncbi:3-keto-5-aminohexanoate cleavage protein [Natronomonas sp. CBA1123]|uniref:3-keto-5-aminohexanoate cleavage protein n=1 Tax=Natronomonas sp. CBA1123 TaxID=2668070 RepID=UPI0012EAD81E|nr:3-keto-5-aminohexanoate cleavage protein [Natronomonas sp. CBA1123]MUV86562.1 3-keto-5-aminohexanoate cleavage protein [Natronomonas sp. CBA1123]